MFKKGNSRLRCRFKAAVFMARVHVCVRLNLSRVKTCNENTATYKLGDKQLIEQLLQNGKVQNFKRKHKTNPGTQRDATGLKNHILYM